MIDATNVLKFLHVLASIIWVGGGFMFQVLLWRARSIGPEATATFNQAAEWTSQRVFMPASFAALIFGVATVISGNYDWGDTWITLGFVGFAISAVNGMAVLGPTSKKMKAIIEERGPNDPVATHMARRLDLFGRVDLVVLITVVFIMIVKPGLG
jgi:uncharacterized membrane protein